MSTLAKVRKSQLILSAKFSTILTPKTDKIKMIWCWGRAYPQKDFKAKTYANTRSCVCLARSDRGNRWNTSFQVLSESLHTACKAASIGFRANLLVCELSPRLYVYVFLYGTPLQFPGTQHLPLVLLLLSVTAPGPV